VIEAVLDQLFETADAAGVEAFTSRRTNA